MILDRCPTCKRPGRAFCERLGRPCVRDCPASGLVARQARKPPRYDNGRLEALRDHWAEKAAIYQQEKADYLARNAGKELVQVLASRKPRPHVKPEATAQRQREYDRKSYAANRDEIRAKRRDQQRRKTETRERRKASMSRYVA